jgi:hypothetical protein
MLNKEICKKCKEKHHKPYKNSIYWSKKVEKRWNNGWISCPYIYGAGSITIKIPDKCPYKLEHILKEDKE